MPVQKACSRTTSFGQYHQHLISLTSGVQASYRSKSHFRKWLLLGSPEQIWFSMTDSMEEYARLESREEQASSIVEMCQFKRREQRP